MFGSLKQRITKSFRKRQTHMLDVEDVLLDAYNLPQYNTAKLEGKLVKPIARGAPTLVLGLFFLVCLVLVGRLATLQLVLGNELADQSERNRLQQSILFAERGVILDRNGEPLAWNEKETVESQFSTRAYSARKGLAHITGYVSLPKKDAQGVFHRTESEGVAGAEYVFSDSLSGENGARLVERDAIGSVRAQSAIEAPESGANITLTLDARVTEALHSFIAAKATSTPFVGGAGVIMDVESGDVLALTSVPEYDPRILSKGIDFTKIKEYQSDQRGVFLNRAIAGLYTPGSIVKPFMALAALEEEIILPGKTIVSTGALQVPNPYLPGSYTVFRDWRAHGAVTMKDALALSSNVYFFQIGGGFEGQEGLGISRIERYARLFGLGEPTGIVLTSESVGTIPNPSWKEQVFGDSVWRLGDTYNTSIGQYGFQMTPLQAARMAAAIANRGELVTPRITQSDRSVKEKIPVNDKHFTVVHEGMRQAVTSGTAHYLNMPFVALAAKTGTAEVGVNNEFDNSWIIGFWPYEEPKYAFAILMERGPIGSGSAASVVAQQFFYWMQENAPEYLE